MPRVLLTEEEKRERRKKIDKKWRDKNKKKIAEKGKKYREKHKEKIAENYKQWNEENKDKRREYNKQWNEENKDKLAEYRKQYKQTETGKKVNTIAIWKKRGLKCEDYDSLYAHYILAENCDECNVRFGEWGDRTGSFKCMDHDHQTGQFRNFLCCGCNRKRD